MPDALEPLVEYFLCISGEHPGGDVYRQAAYAVAATPAGAQVCVPAERSIRPPGGR